MVGSAIASWALGGTRMSAVILPLLSAVDQQHLVDVPTHGLMSPMGVDQ